ncbi:S-adenosyl-L-methionine-dependent methyltransferase [Lindgomyces ingoldianus]|uniref:S-adenosyl-L-methionine-dependent methyltransferase n=1 Tax=Lindgomyces ingoldianus TaxID=673940 RepID=A0ACB6QF17_9PLEO|nr:S-adenosyl-L-methionine-dependent methyltransferase [Lindgomyces ingoldianus]KAF2465589.1 S-adenosyl-L-methionine-dependent methyltransferase [Lindgomyces ingoldianus]
MARGGSKRGNRGGGNRHGNKKGSKRNDRSNAVRSEPWSTIPRTNDYYEAYYSQGGFMGYDELTKMWEYMKTDLPTSWRFTGTKTDALAVRDIFKERYIPRIAATEWEGQPVQPPEPVSAFPDELTWHMKTDKKVIRRNKQFAEFQKFLVAETSSGNISRQEVVSMVPPHFLDVKPGMVVLDMCAAPGSKSAQLAEMIHGDEEDRVQMAASSNAHDMSDKSGDYSDDGRSTGLLVANDTDYKRAGMLVHQVKRLNFPNLIITQHDAAAYPSLEIPAGPAGGKKKYLKFDRVLADVPCSGDGTTRKNTNVWQKWTPKDALGLHGLQVRILIRGLQLLKKGGRLVYSTCSMNPVENEAVVADAIRQCGGVSKVTVVNCDDHLPNLIRRPGLKTWKVMDMSSVLLEDKKPHMFTSWEKFEEVRESVKDENRSFSRNMTPGMFPPTNMSEEERIPLENCMRVYPHLQDTSGFFITVLEKKEDIKVAQVPSKTEEESGLTETQNGTSLSRAGSKRQRSEGADESQSPKRVKTSFTNGTEPDIVATEDTQTPVTTNVDAKMSANGAVKDEKDTKEIFKKLNRNGQPAQTEFFEYLAPDDPTIKNITDFFGISARFPRNRFMVKNKEGIPANKIYYTSELAKDILTMNKDRGVKFVHCGVVTFMSHKVKDTDNPGAKWRLQDDGIRILEPWAAKRIITLKSKATLHKLLIEMFPIMPKDGKHKLDDVGDQLAEMDVGCCFLKIEKSDGGDSMPFPMVLPVWRHPGSINLMVSNEDRLALLLRFWDELNPPIINHVKDKQAAKEAALAVEDQETALAVEGQEMVDIEDK